MFDCRASRSSGHCKIFQHLNALSVHLFVLMLYTLHYTFNPYKPSVPFWGHRQTVQTEIRRRGTRRLIRVFTVCLQEFLFEIE